MPGPSSSTPTATAPPSGADEDRDPRAAARLHGAQRVADEVDEELLEPLARDRASAGRRRRRARCPADSASGARRSRISSAIASARDRLGVAVRATPTSSRDELGEVVEQLDRAPGLAAHERQVLVVARRRRRRASPRRSRRSPAAARAARAGARRRARRAALGGVERRDRVGSSRAARSRQSSCPSSRASTSSSACSSALNSRGSQVVEAERPEERRRPGSRTSRVQKARMSQSTPSPSFRREPLLPERRHLARVRHRRRRLARRGCASTGSHSYGIAASALDRQRAAASRARGRRTAPSAVISETTVMSTPVVRCTSSVTAAISSALVASVRAPSSADLRKADLVAAHRRSAYSAAAAQKREGPPKRASRSSDETGSG